MKGLRKWTYPLLFVASGAVYFACVDHGQVYEESLLKLSGWYEGLREDGSGRSAMTRRSAMAEAALAGTEALRGTVERGSGGAFWQQLPEGGGDMTGVGEGSGHDGSGQSGSQDDSVQSGDGQGDPEGGLGQEGNGPDGPEGDFGHNGSGEDVQGGAEGGSGEDGQGGPGEGSGQEPGEPKSIEYTTVEDDYFADAVFIGDSRTVGMFEYGGLEEISTFYASKGLTIYKMFDSAVAPSPEGKITVEEALQANQFAKIYLMIGINEMGTGTLEGFLEKYAEAVAHLQELQPEAIIYLQGIMKVTSQRSAQGDYINNEGIEARNEGIAKLADNEKVFYLDVNPMICDETGGMDPEYTYDGVHLKGKHIQIWKDYLKTHAISP